MDPDVLIVGAGPAGAVTALGLAQEGFKVTVLEQGDWPDYDKANTADPAFALTADRDWGWDPNLRAAPGQRAIPFDADAPDYLDLLESVKSRGPVYRATP